MPLTGTHAAPTRVREGAEWGDAWDAFVAARPEGTFCHLSGWREVMLRVFGHRASLLAAVGPDGELTGGLPLVRLDSRLFGRALLSMPYLNYGGPIGTPEAQRALVEAAVDAARRQRARLELRNAAPIASALPARVEKVTVVLDLPDSAETLWKETIRAKVRSQIRRPQKEGLTARFGPGERGAFYEVFARNMRDLGTPVLPRSLFEALWRVFPDLVLFGAVYAGERPVAAGCGFLWRGEFEMTWASSLREFNPVSPNMLLYWEFMAHVIERGGRRFNFGRCSPGGGTHRFKLQWGGAEVPLPWVRWPSPEGAGPAGEGRLLRLASRGWQRLPLPVANRLGPFLARRLPHF